MGRNVGRRSLATELARRYPSLQDPRTVISAGEILVNGIARSNPESLVCTSDAITIRGARQLRGSPKLTHALDSFAVRVDGRVAIDIGAAAGGFTQVLLARGATRVYAVDVGYGQLRGTLRQDPRVIALERTNLGDLDQQIVPEPVQIITLDLSYLSLARAVPQLEALRTAQAVDLVAVVKPAYELGLGRLPVDEDLIAQAVRHATTGLVAAGWLVCGAVRSPVLGGRGAIEWLVHARRDRQ
jgi:23S rRNA (cytidine1920-2'-O)/16S rRNA (cytidine1409-2'-O)-methyltransferase